MAITLSCDLFLWRARIEKHCYLYRAGKPDSYLIYFQVPIYFIIRDGCQKWTNWSYFKNINFSTHHNRLHQAQRCLMWQVLLINTSTPSSKALFFFLNGFNICVYKLMFCTMSHDLMKTEKCKTKCYFCYTCGIVNQVQKRTHVTIVSDKKFLSQIIEWIYIQG